MRLPLSVIRKPTLVLASLAGHTVRIAHILPGMAGAAMVSYGAAMIYTPAGVIIGGAFLLLIDRQIALGAQKRPRSPAPMEAP